VGLLLRGRRGGEGNGEERKGEEEGIKGGEVEGWT